MRSFIPHHETFPANSKNVTVRNANVNSRPPQSWRSLLGLTEKAEIVQMIMNNHQQIVKKFKLNMINAFCRLEYISPQIIFHSGCWDIIQCAGGV